ncbi:MAG: Spy0128 family protein [Anaerovoracaceae bacterium]|jgi:pilin isopeptide linkage protein/uncharacterized repeat protein (TIGR02543 family)
MGKKLMVIAAAFLLALSMMPAGTFAADGATYTVLIKYIDQTTNKAVAHSYKAVLAPNDTYSADSPTVSGYTLADSSQATVSGTATEDATITVKYTPKDAEYKINYYFQNDDDVYVQDESRTETKTAKCNSTVTIEPKTFEGFECVTTGDDLKLTIPTDGTTVEKNLYYDRTDKKRIIYFRTGGGSHVEKIVAAAGTDITDEIAARTTGSQVPTKKGYKFESWESNDTSFDPTADPCIMPDHNVTLTAKWKNGKAKYTVLYKFKRYQSYAKDAEGNDRTNVAPYYDFLAVEKEGTVGDTIAYDWDSDDDDVKDQITAEYYEFEKAETDKVIKADDSTVEIVYCQPVEVELVLYDIYHTLADPDGDGTYDIVDYEVGETKTVRLGDWFTLPDGDYIIHNKVSAKYGKKYWDYIFEDKLFPANNDKPWYTQWRYDDYRTGSPKTKTIISPTPYVGPEMIHYEDGKYVAKIFPYQTQDTMYDYYIQYYHQDPNDSEKYNKSSFFHYQTTLTLIKVIPQYVQGYSLEFYKRSLGAYVSGTENKMKTLEIDKDSDETPPEEREYWMQNDPDLEGGVRNYLEFFYNTKVYTLTYLNGTEILKTETYNYGKTVNLSYVPDVPEDLAAQGYTFGGWYRQGDNTETIVSKVTMDLDENRYNFQAKWDPPSYTVTFDLNGGTMTSATSQTIKKGEQATEPAPAPTRDGYVFAGWYEKSSGALYEFDESVESNIELVARWKPAADTVKYTVRHQLADGTVLKTEIFEVSSLTKYVTARCLEEDDAAYPDSSALPDAIYKSLRLSTNEDENVITFTYEPAPTYTYTIRHLDRDTGAAIAGDRTITDIAVIMTVAAEEISGYTKEQVYGRGDKDNTTIPLYYRKNNSNPSEPGSITVHDPPVEKQVTGDTPDQDSVFTFTMEALPDQSTLPEGMDQLPMPAGAEGQSVEVSITGSGSAEFGDITFTKPGTYVYRITENAGSDENYTYDTTAYIVKYVVTQDSLGNLTAERQITKNGEAVTKAVFTFVNEYTEPEPGSITVNDPPVKKDITGGTPKKDAVFSFTMKALPQDSTLPEGMTSLPMPGGASGQSVTIHVTGSGTGEFGNIVFTAPGTYVYRITERNTGNRNYRYDGTVYQVKYVVTEDENGTLHAERTITKDGEETESASFRFVNQYLGSGDNNNGGGETNGKNPQNGEVSGGVRTGDTSGIGGYLFLLTASLGSLIAVEAVRRRRMH